MQVTRNSRYDPQIIATKARIAGWHVQEVGHVRVKVTLASLHTSRHATER